MSKKVVEAKVLLDCIAVYRGLLQDCVISKLHMLLNKIYNNDHFNELISCYNDFYYTLIKYNSVKPFKDYIINRLIYEETAFSRLSEKLAYNLLHPGLLEAVKNDLIYLENISNLTAKDIKESILTKYKMNDFESEIVQKLPEWNIDHKLINDEKEEQDIVSLFKSKSNWAQHVKFLYDFHKENGSGEFARFKGFIWERSGNGKGLKGVEIPDPVRFSDLIGYESERQIIIDNTLSFLKGYPANNILLYGDRGTGKSSTVKALLNEYGHLGLRIIEIPKMLLTDFYHILRLVENRPQKFIAFIDDLAFQDNEQEYTALKAVLEGGLENRPKNLIIYATSNRRHLVKEKFSDRSGLMYGSQDEEVHAADTLQEKLSLADRFGITVTFSAPDKLKFLEIVEGLAEKRGLDIDKETLHKEALKWEMWYNGFSPRTARQFIDWLEGTRNNKF